MKYNQKIVDHICSLISLDSYTIPEICNLSGISEATYHEWKNRKPYFLEAVSRAREQFDQLIVKEAKNSLRKKINGYDVDEKKTVYINGKDGKPIIKEQSTIKKHFPPDGQLIQYVLNNKAGDEYKNKQINEVTGKDGKPLNQQIIVRSQQAAEDVKSLFE